MDSIFKMVYKWLKIVIEVAFTLALQSRKYSTTSKPLLKFHTSHGRPFLFGPMPKKGPLCIFSCVLLPRWTGVRIARGHPWCGLVGQIAKVILDGGLCLVVLTHGPGHHVSASTRHRTVRQSNFAPNKNSIFRTLIRPTANATRVHFLRRSNYKVTSDGL